MASEAQSVTLTVRVPAHLVDRLERESERSQIGNSSAILRAALVRYLDEAEARRRQIELTTSRA